MEDDCLCEVIFGFRYAREQAQVRAFYGDHAYEAILKWEKEQREWRDLVYRSRIGLIDDIGSQLKGE